LWPPLALSLLTLLAVLLWLLVMGVNAQRWEEQATASAASRRA
jgi:hypothetical protein